MPPPAAAEDPPAPQASGADARELLRVRADAAGGAQAALACLATHGAVLLDAALPEAAVTVAAAALAPFLDDVAARWDADADALPLSWRKYGITRCPRVNAGKKNVHFDPHGARLQAAAALSQRVQLLRKHVRRGRLLTHSRAQGASYTTRWRRWRLQAASRRC